tara:strand:+ start:5494 stop:5709 length:216 start_codon:yes stop_codon:yes gene_type:complete
MDSPFEVICVFSAGTSVIDALDQSFDDYVNDSTANYYWQRFLNRSWHSLKTVLDFDYTQGGVRRWYKYTVV